MSGKIILNAQKYSYEGVIHGIDAQKRPWNGDVQLSMLRNLQGYGVENSWHEKTRKDRFIISLTLVAFKMHLPVGIACLLSL